jgi:signal transduction histidine kinase
MAEPVEKSGHRNILLMLAVPLLITIFVAVGLYVAISNYFVKVAEEKVENVLLSNRGFHLYIQKVMHPTFYRALESGMVDPEYYSPEILSSSFIIRNLHGFYNAEREKAKLPKIYYKMASENPRNPVNRADEFESSLIRMFNENRTITEFRKIQTIDGNKYLYFAKPFLETNKACLRCHGRRADAPPGLQTLYPGEGGFNEKDGVIRAIESMRMPIQSEISLAFILTVSVAVGLMTMFFLFLFNTRLRSLVRAKTEVLAGEVTERKSREVELEGKNAELERFTYTVSHDLKSPLITIKGFAGALLKDVTAGRHDRLEGDLHRIMNAADKMGFLLNDLLELSRIGRMSNAPTTAPMAEIIKEALAGLEGIISSRSIEVRVHPDLPTVTVDRQRIVEVVQNLVENAVKYLGDQAEPVVEIGARSDGEETVFFVHDNGIGIDPQYQETVFGLFNKLDAQTDGTGIGLALVRRIIDFHGGRVWVESAGLGKGSTFCFTLGKPKMV